MPELDTFDFNIKREQRGKGTRNVRRNGKENCRRVRRKRHLETKMKEEKVIRKKCYGEKEKRYKAQRK